MPKGWETFRDDQLAVLDAANVGSSCLLVGSCIGPSFIFSLLQHSPARFSAAVLMQPIGLAEHTSEPVHWVGINTGASQHWYGDWAQGMEDDSRAAKPALAALYASMFVLPGRERFCFTAGHSELLRVTHPLLVYAGKDMFHPTDVAKQIAASAPNAEYVERWRDEAYTSDVVDDRIESFLREHSAAAQR